VKKTVAIVIFPDVEELDFVGPWEIFTRVKRLEPALCDVFTVAPDGGEIRCANGLRVIADHSFATAPRADVVVVPGGAGTRAQLENPATIDYIRQADAAAEMTTSVCTGSFLLEAAGLLAGRRATTHWRSIDQLRALGTVQVAEGERWVDEGRIVTSAGVSAGIDMALHVVGRLWEPALARRVQKAVEYLPGPPYADVPLPTEV
jgi:transcriptional regulator GlxA family with amidase domain